MEAGIDVSSIGLREPKARLAGRMLTDEERR
jgi:hypothetical protein